MSNIEYDDDGDAIIGRTYRNEYDNSIKLTISTEFAKELDMENSKVSMSIINGFDGSRHLLVSKYCREIVIE